MQIGTLYQDPLTPACIKIDELLSRHFAVLGTTGVGKSSGVAVILDQVLRSKKDVRIFLLDVHNEYKAAFGARANVINPHTLKLPFWLFNLEEFADVVYGGRQPVDEEIEILTRGDPAREEQVCPVQGGRRAAPRQADARQGRRLHHRYARARTCCRTWSR